MYAIKNFKKISYCCWTYMHSTVQDNLTTARHFLIDPVNETADTCKHSVIVGLALWISPADSPTQHPFPSLFTDEWTTAVSVATTCLVCISTSCTNHTGFFNGNHLAVYTTALVVCHDRKFCLLECVCGGTSSNKSAPSWRVELSIMRKLTLRSC